MDLKQIHFSAKTKNNHLNDAEYTKVYVSAATDNRAGGVTYNRLQEDLAPAGLKVNLIRTGSSGYYDLEPTVLVKKPSGEAVLYARMTGETVPEFVKSVLIERDPRPDLAYCSFGEAKIEGVSNAEDLPLFKLQKRIALRNCGYLDPENIDQYVLWADGYQGLDNCLKKKPADVIEELNEAGLRGRGGAGFITADKWKLCRDAEGNEKYLICNAVDSDPRALTARLLLQSDPHSVLEGVLIGAYAVGASRCFVCVAEDDKQAIGRLSTALLQMSEYGLTGDNIMDSNFSAHIEVKAVKRSLVAGEETALIRALENKQAMPYLRLSYPATNGFQGKPTLVNSVETFANIAAIFGGNPAQIGGDNTGTKILSLAGKVEHKYTVEVSLGTTLRAVIAGIGGVPEGERIKAVQFGGPTGSYFGVDSLDTGIDYESIKEAGSIIGSGTIEVFDTGSCAVETARDNIYYLKNESCGKCIFCREGTYQMAMILGDIVHKGGNPEDLEMLTELGQLMRTGTICGLGKTAANPVLSSIKLFREEYDYHVKERKCPIENHASKSKA